MLRSTVSLKSPVLGKIKNNAGILTLNKPKTLNSLDLEMVNIMHNQLKTWMQPSPSVKLVIQNATGGKAFCAGGDVRAITDAGKAGNTQLGKDFFGTEYKLDYALATLPVPLVSIVDGICMGGGVGISVHGTYRVATEKTLFAMPETGIGLFPDVGGGHFLPRLKHHNMGRFLALTGHRLRGVDNLHVGIATHVCEKSKIESLTEQLTLANGKDEIEDTLMEFQEASLKNNTDLNNRFSLADNLHQISYGFNGHSISQIQTDLLDLNNEWCDKQIKIINKMSPISLHVTLEQLKRGKLMNLEQVLNMEHGIGSECMEQKDFYEGIRALLVDKDNNPKWVTEFNDKDIDKYFDGSDWKPEKW